MPHVSLVADRRTHRGIAFRAGESRAQRQPDGQQRRCYDFGKWQNARRGPSTENYCARAMSGVCFATVSSRKVRCRTKERWRSGRKELAACAQTAMTWTPKLVV